MQLSYLPRSMLRLSQNVSSLSRKYESNYFTKGKVKISRSKGIFIVIGYFNEAN